jgi:leader peptidase (prepilin peptidase)/N-methyltransferase
MAMLVPVVVIDVRRRLIPDLVLAPGAIVAVGLLVLTMPEALPEHLAAACAAGAFFAGAALARPEGLGAGDVKLAAVMGLYLGRAVAPALVLALLAGAFAGMVIVLRRGLRAGRRATVPFAPFLAAGGVAGLLAGGPAADWWERVSA